MAKKKSEAVPRQPSKIDWQLAIRDVPTEGFWPVDESLDNPAVLEEAVELFIDYLEEGSFLTWEAVIREEQGLPLSRAHKKSLKELLSFSDEPDDERVLAINEVPRPPEPWYETFRELVSALPHPPLDTTGCYYETQLQGWDSLVEAVTEHAKGLERPENLAGPLEVIEESRRHELWILHCCEVMVGIGQAEELSLSNQEQAEWRIRELCDRLQEQRDSVALLNLTVGGLADYLRMPAKEEKLLRAQLLKILKASSSEQLLFPLLED